MADKKPLIFSVESRKGGVGKTTVALNIAKCLIKKYNVLLIDCDVTGTSISHMALDSLYWSEQVDVHKEKEDTVTNLVMLFDNYLKKGVIKDDENTDFFHHSNIDKVVVLGSDLYHENKEVVDPRILQDSVHGFWFCEMLDGIISDFKKLETENERNTAIIIDNSPGLLGIGKAIQDWLIKKTEFDVKFVMVSSVDRQDVEATVSAAVDLNKTIGYAKTAAQIYIDSKTTGELSEENYKKIREEKIDSFFGNMIRDNVELNDYARPDIKILFNKVPVSDSQPFSALCGPDMYEPATWDNIKNFSVSDEEKGILYVPYKNYWQLQFVLKAESASRDNLSIEEALDKIQVDDSNVLDSSLQILDKWKYVRGALKESDLVWISDSINRWLWSSYKEKFNKWEIAFRSNALIPELDDDTVWKDTKEALQGMISSGINKLEKGDLKSVRDAFRSVKDYTDKKGDNVNNRQVSFAYYFFTGILIKAVSNSKVEINQLAMNYGAIKSDVEAYYPTVQQKLKDISGLNISGLSPLRDLYMESYVETVGRSIMHLSHLKEDIELLKAVIKLQVKYSGIDLLKDQVGEKLDKVLRARSEQTSKDELKSMYEDAKDMIEFGDIVTKIIK